MLPQVTLPPSLAMLVEVFGSCFTVPTFATFRVLLAGLIAQTGRRTVCGMLLGAGVAEWMPRARAPRLLPRGAVARHRGPRALPPPRRHPRPPPGRRTRGAVRDAVFPAR